MKLTFAGRPRRNWEYDAVVILGLSCWMVQPFCSSAQPYAGTVPLKQPALFAVGSITSAEYEFGLAFTAEGATAYFARLAADRAEPVIFESQFTNGAWGVPRAATFGRSNEGGPAISPDGSRFAFWSCRPLPGSSSSGAPHLWTMERAGDRWSTPKNVGPQVNGSGWEGQISPEICANGTLYFAAARPGGQGGYDVYRALGTNGIYGTPENLGRAVNSNYDEMSVCVSSNESVIIFSGIGRPDSFGTGDLYVSCRSNQAWLPARNLGPLVNTPGNETCPRLSPDNKYLFFTRDGDIYQIELSAVLELPDESLRVWKRKTDMRTPRVWARGAAVDGKIYVAGGMVSWAGGQTTRAVEEYDPATDQWTNKAPLPADLALAPVTMLNGKLCIFGNNVPGLAYEYDPATNRWTLHPGQPCPYPASPTTMVVEANGRLFALRRLWAYGDAIATMAEYDFTNRCWVSQGNLPFSYGGAQVISGNGKLYALGGSGGPEQAFQEYDLTTDRWTIKPTMPTSRVEVRGTVCNGNLYAVGGHSPQVGASLNSVEVYDPELETWSSLPDLPIGMWGACVVALKGKLYVIGGCPDAVGSAPGLKTVWEYDLGNPLTLSVGRGSLETLTFHVFGPAGKQYRLDESTDLHTWQPKITNTCTGFSQMISVPIHQGAVCGFYRAGLLGP